MITNTRPSTCEGRRRRIATPSDRETSIAFATVSRLHKIEAARIAMRAELLNVRYWTKADKVVARDGLSANDPQRTFV